MTAFRGVLHGIAQQVVQDDFQFVYVYPCFQRSVCTFECQADTLLHAVSSECLRELADVQVHVVLGYFDSRTVSFFSVEVNQFVGQFCQTVRVTDGALQVFLSLFGEFLGAAYFAERTFDKGQRRTDVMCRIDEELNLLMRKHTFLAHPDVAQDDGDSQQSDEHIEGVRPQGLAERWFYVDAQAPFFEGTSVVQEDGAYFQCIVTWCQVRVSDEMSGTIQGKNIKNFFNTYKTNKFSFKLTIDGYVDEDESAE